MILKFPDFSLTFYRIPWLFIDLEEKTNILTFPDQWAACLRHGGVESFVKILVEGTMRIIPVKLF